MGRVRLKSWALMCTLFTDKISVSVQQDPPSFHRLCTAESDNKVSVSNPVNSDCLFQHCSKYPPNLKAQSVRFENEDCTEWLTTAMIGTHLHLFAHICLL